MKRSSRLGKRWKVYFLHLFLVAITIAFLFPLIWIYLTSFKTKLQAFAIPPVWIFRPTVENYKRVFTYMHFFDPLLNSLIVATATTLLSMLVGTLAAYGLTRFRFKSRGLLRKMLLTSRMLPATATVIPLFLVFKNLKMLDSYLSLVLTYTSYNLGLVSWMMIGFLAEVPRELEEAAMTDGCSRFGAFIRVVLPLIAPGLAATAVFAFLASWNEFVFALIFMSSNITLPVAIATSVTEVGVRWGEVAAMSGMAIVPVLLYTFLVAQYIVQGLTLGAVKG